MLNIIISAEIQASMKSPVTHNDERPLVMTLLLNILIIPWEKLSSPFPLNLWNLESQIGILPAKYCENII